MKRHVFWHFVSAKNLNCGVFQTKFLVELETVKFCVLFCLAWDYSFVSGSQLRLVVLHSKLHAPVVLSTCAYTFFIDPSLNWSTKTNGVEYPCEKLKNFLISIIYRQFQAKWQEQIVFVELFYGRNIRPEKNVEKKWDLLCNILYCKKFHSSNMVSFEPPFNLFFPWKIC